MKKLSEMSSKKLERGNSHYKRSDTAPDNVNNVGGDDGYRPGGGGGVGGGGGDERGDVYTKRTLMAVKRTLSERIPELS